MAGVADKVYNLIKDTVEEQGVTLWDVKYLKEGASYYLRVFIDKIGGVSIDDCTDVSHAIDPIIDEADPIDGSYYLEVCSAGLTRELCKPEHFEYAIGKKVKIKLFKCLNGSKTVEGKLLSYGEEIKLLCENEEISIDKKLISKVNVDE